MNSEKEVYKSKVFEKGIDDNNYMGDRLENYYFIYSHNRDSDILQESNYETITKLLDDNNHNYEIHRFDHWLCGWVEAICINETEIKAIKFCEELKERLESYPLLDDIDYYEREAKEINNSWSDWIEWNFRNSIESKFEIDLDLELDLKPLLDKHFMIEYTGSETYIEPDIKVGIKNITEKELKEFIK